MKDYGFGVDLGGTTCKMGLFKTDGTLLDKWEIPTDTSNNGENILGNIADAIADKMTEKKIGKEEVEGIGIGVPGPVNKDGVVIKCVNLGWGIFSIVEEMERLTGMKVKAGNDANVAALGESWMGSGKDFNSIVMVTLGTGIGGGVVIDHKILTGAVGAAGEIGHIGVNDEETEACNCGQYGCIEQYASATGIARMARRQLTASNEKSVHRQFDQVTAKDVFDAAKEGDFIAKLVVEDVCSLLASTLCKISCVVNPEAFLIGGGVSKAGEYLIHAIEKPYYEKVFHACRDTKIVLATLGNDAGIYGGVRMLLV